jgi:hypothetical protein
MRGGSGGGGYGGTIVVDIPGVRRASGRLADDAHAYQELAARVRGHVLPSMPDDVAGRTAAVLGEVGSGLAAQPQPLVGLAQELRVRAFWAEIADRLLAGNDLDGGQLTEFKAAYASGLLTRYAEPGQADLAKAYAEKVHDREHPGGLGGFFHDVGDFFSGAWDAIKDPAVMIYHLTPFSDGCTEAWGDLGHGLAYGVTHPVEFGKALVNLDALQERGVSYWLGNLAPAVAATLLSGGAAAGVRGAEGVAAVDRAAEGAAALDRAAEGASALDRAAAGAADLERAEGLAGASTPEWLRRLQEGNAFNRERAPFYEHSELYVDKPGGEGYFRVDSYDTVRGEIVSRKHTQLGGVSEETALRYVRELGDKYSPGTPIADVPSTPPWLHGERLEGKLVLEVPSQTASIPDRVLYEATRLNIEIRDVDGHVYNAQAHMTAGAR